MEENIKIENYETRHGLLYYKGEANDHNFIGTWKADRIAKALGFVYCEQLVEALEKGKEKE